MVSQAPSGSGAKWEGGGEWDQQKFKAGSGFSPVGICKQCENFGCNG